MSFGFSVGDFIAVLQLANDTRKQFVDAPSQFKAICDDVKSLSTVLRDLDDVLPERDLTSQQQTEFGNIIRDCRDVLQDLDKTLNKFKGLDNSAKSVDGKARRIWKRFKWDQRDFDEFRSRIGSSILLLNTFLVRISSQAVFATRDGVERLHERHDIQDRQQEHKVMLDWLTPVNYAPQQSDLISRRQAGTGQWLLDSKEFKKWVGIQEEDGQNQDGQDSTHQSEPRFFCPGIPGAGKTIISAIVVDDLCMKFQQDSNVGIAYLYCNFKRTEEQKLLDLLLSLLKQLAQGRSSIPDAVKLLYDRHNKNPPTRPSLDDISEALCSVIALYNRAFVIVDALDECQVSDGCRSRFLSNIFNLQAKTGVKLFATSRPIPDIERLFTGCLSCEILATDEDVCRYLDDHMFRLPRFVAQSVELQEEVKSEICKAVNGMFLLAQLHLDSLIRKKSPKALRTALKNLATGSGAYDHAYKNAMERIQGQLLDEKVLAKQVLSWITCAKRPLMTSELQYAMAGEIDGLELDEENLPQIDDIVSVCAGLVTVDEESNIIRLVHYTTQQYFQRTQSNWFPDIEAEITTICVTYLSFSVFQNGICQTDDDFEERLRLHPLYDYASHNWGHHARKALTSCPRVIQFLQKQAQIEASSQALTAVKEWSGQKAYSQSIPKQMTGLHLAAYFGVDTAVRVLSNISPDLKNSYDRTPLSWAAENGHEAVVKLLLERDNIDANSKDIGNRTPLSWAARNGHEAVVKLLLERDNIDANSKDIGNRTPLSWAARNGHEAVVKLLLERDNIDADSKDEYSQTPLSWAARNGHEAVVKLLLERDNIDANSKDMGNRTPLSWAARNGHEAVVKLLLERDNIDADSKDMGNWTPLSLAAEFKHKAVIKLLTSIT